jgi:hypothetical protein
MAENTAVCQMFYAPFMQQMNFPNTRHRAQNVHATGVVVGTIGPASSLRRRLAPTSWKKLCPFQFVAIIKFPCALPFNG